MATLQLKNIQKIYEGNVQAVYDFNLEVEDNEFIVFVGPSGCGKSTTIRMIAGLEDITSGELLIDGKLMNNVEPKDRDIAMVFQSYALYPHMSVYDNMAFALKLKKMPKSEIDVKVKEAANILGLTDMLSRKPKALSGGQRQRVALGRAIVRDAKIFLMDEPLSNLDAKLRVSMRSEIIKLHERLATTTIYVTHDQTEAMTMATRIVVMKDGYIQQIGTPKEIYNDPANIFVAEFTGSPAMNILHGVFDGISFITGDIVIPIPKGRLKALEPYTGKEIVLGIRPENILSDNVLLETYPDSSYDLDV
ncbi:MAG: ABC transporter ATP-binding protein, partial [Bacilli bacterium]